MQIAIGSDHRGVDVKSKVVQALEEMGHQVTDVGAHDSTGVD